MREPNWPQIGERFGRLTVIETGLRHGKGNRPSCRCKCDCGNTVLVFNTHLRTGHTTSCGCKYRTQDGLCYTRIYNIWRKIKGRCYNKNDKSYFDYGGRGITICDEWYYSFSSFYSWSMNNGYDDSLSIDRINNNKGYCPENCRWADSTTQSNNRRNCKYYTKDGITQTISM